MRPIIRPGLRVLRRDPWSLQVGLDWPGLTVLRETAALRAVIAAIDGFRDATGVVGAAAAAGGCAPAECADALARLVDCGAVVDADLRRDGDVSESTWAAWSLLAGPQQHASDIAGRRRSRCVHVTGTGHLADAVRGLLPASYVRLADHTHSADLVIVASDREHDRAASDELMHRSVPQLWVCQRDLVGVLGPFVLPGQTACLRCVDRAQADLDPAWPTLVAATTAHPIQPAASDLVSAALLGAWAVQEVSLWASGIEPSTCTHVVEIPNGTGTVDCRATARHPQCGCSWLEWHDTMGA